MIEKLFKSSMPIHITDCYILVDNKPVQLQEAFLFISHTSRKVARIGDDWMTDHIRDKVQIIGSMYTDYTSLGLFNEELVGQDIIFIGNKGRSEYKLTGVSIKKSKNHIGKNPYNILKFGALDYEIVHHQLINDESDSE